MKRHLHLGEIFETAVQFDTDEEIIAYLREHNSTYLQMWLSLVFDPTIEFRINKIPTLKLSEKPHPEYYWSNLIKELRRMHILAKGKNAGLTDEQVSSLIFNIYDALAQSEQKLLKALVEDRKLPQKKLTKEFMARVFPDTFFRFTEMQPVVNKSKEPSNKKRSLAEDDVRKIKKLLKRGDISQSKIAKQFGASAAVISLIKKGKTYADVTIDKDK